MYNSIDNQKSKTSYSLSYAERIKQMAELLTAKLNDESALIGLSLEPKQNEVK